MVLLRVFAALSWFVAVGIFGINFLYEQPLGPGGWFVIVSAIVFTTLKLIEEAIDAVDGAVDRRSQI